MHLLGVAYCSNKFYYSIVCNNNFVFRSFQLYWSYGMSMCVCERSRHKCMRKKELFYFFFFFFFHARSMTVINLYLAFLWTLQEADFLSTQGTGFETLITSSNSIQSLWSFLRINLSKIVPENVINCNDWASEWSNNRSENSEHKLSPGKTQSESRRSRVHRIWFFQMPIRYYIVLQYPRHYLSFLRYFLFLRTYLHTQATWIAVFKISSPPTCPLLAHCQD